MIDETFIDNPGLLTTTVYTADRCTYIKKVYRKCIIWSRIDIIWCCWYIDEKDVEGIYNLVGTKICFKSEEDQGDTPFT